MVETLKQEFSMLVKELDRFREGSSVKVKEQRGEGTKSKPGVMYARSCNGGSDYGEWTS